MRSFVPHLLNDVGLMEEADRDLRVGDVVVATFPKSGQTAIQALLLGLQFPHELEGDDPPLHRPGVLYGRQRWSEFMFPRVMVEDGGVLQPVAYDANVEDAVFQRSTVAEEMAVRRQAVGPRVFKSHSTYNDWVRSPNPDVQAGVKYVTVVRDIRDVPYSFYRHQLSVNPAYRAAMKMDAPRESFDSFFEQFLNPSHPFCPVQFYRELHPHLNDINLLVLRYEDFINDRRATALQLCEFLGWPVPDDESLAKILEFSSVEFMREHEDFFIPHRVVFNRGPFIREGGVGGNRAHLSARQAEQLRALIESKIPECIDLLFAKPTGK